MRSVLRGPAFVAISGITLSNEKYDMVVALLKEEFRKPESAIEALYASFSTCQLFQIDLMILKRVHKNIERILRGSR